MSLETHKIVVALSLAIVAKLHIEEGRSIHTIHTYIHQSKSSNIADIIEASSVFVYTPA